ncbi:MAG: hypothetical protein SFV81_10750 [Pirellulaceae bacterium]|nr:hypothetical protein [Pirellulaceae bacterium]
MSSAYIAAEPYLSNETVQAVPQVQQWLDVSVRNACELQSLPKKSCAICRLLAVCNDLSYIQQKADPTIELLLKEITYDVSLSKQSGNQSKRNRSRRQDLSLTIINSYDHIARISCLFC